MSEQRMLEHAIGEQKEIIDRLTALLAERDKEIEKLKLIEVVYRAIMDIIITEKMLATP